MHTLDPTHLLNTYGTWGLIGIIFAECGLFFCFFFPGDSLLVTAGLLASTHKHNDAHFNIVLVVVGSLLAALTGDQVGYWFGRRVGPAIFSRPESRFFKPHHLQRAHGYLDERGPRMIVSARFVPGVRTFMPIVAGAGSMRYRLWVTVDVLGGVVWIVGVTMTGYVLGSSVPHIDDYLVPVFLAIIVISLIPLALEVRRARREGRETAPLS